VYSIVLRIHPTVETRGVAAFLVVRPVHFRPDRAVWVARPRMCCYDHLALPPPPKRGGRALFQQPMYSPFFSLFRGKKGQKTWLN